MWRGWCLQPLSLDLHGCLLQLMCNTRKRHIWFKVEVCVKWTIFFLFRTRNKSYSGGFLQIISDRAQLNILIVPNFVSRQNLGGSHSNFMREVSHNWSFPFFKRKEQIFFQGLLLPSVICFFLQVVPVDPGVADPTDWSSLIFLTFLFILFLLICHHCWPHGESGGRLHYVWPSSVFHWPCKHLVSLFSPFTTCHIAVIDRGTHCCKENLSALAFLSFKSPFTASLLKTGLQTSVWSKRSLLYIKSTHMKHRSGQTTLH